MPHYHARSRFLGIMNTFIVVVEEGDHLDMEVLLN